jgi:ketol-acid reductoisomerase
MYDTTFEKEVYSDLYGERGVVSTFLPLPHELEHL